jgi:hypothetical protein
VTAKDSVWEGTDEETEIDVTSSEREKYGETLKLLLEMVSMSSGRNKNPGNLRKRTWLLRRAMRGTRSQNSCQEDDERRNRGVSGVFGCVRRFWACVVRNSHDHG